MNTLQVLRFERDRELTGDIVPEAYFRCQAVRELSFPWASRSFERQFTEIRAGWTDKFLYLHLWAKDSWITPEDSLTLALMPEEGRYWVWEANALGALSSCRVEGWGSGPVEERHLDNRWKSAAAWKAKRHDAGWVFEVKVPFHKDLGRIPQRGDVWRATFQRADADRQGRSTVSTFSDFEASSEVWFHQPSRFGQIVFG